MSIKDRNSKEKDCSNASLIHIKMSSVQVVSSWKKAHFEVREEIPFLKPFLPIVEEPRWNAFHSALETMM